MSYPPFRGPRLLLREALARAGGPVAGRLTGHAGHGWLRDRSGSVEIDWEPSAAAPGDIVSGRLVREPAGWRLEQPSVLAPARRATPPVDAGRLEWIRARARLLVSLREVFEELGLLEVASNALVPNPGLEPHLVALGVELGAERRWLRTSPELALKRLLAAGLEGVWELARVWRGDERGPWHLLEFDLLEWYRAYAGLDAIVADLERLLPVTADALGGAPEGVSLEPPFERTTVRDAVERHCALDLAALGETEALRRALTRLGHASADDDDWDTLFFRLWLAEVEPRLGQGAPVLVFDWPVSQAALARLRPDPEWPVAERFELYLRGVELANAFDELNDPDEQRRRHQRDRETRREAGAEPYPLDEEFLGALERGMPPAAGIAFGLDRWLALLLGREELLGLGPGEGPRLAPDPR